MMQGFAYDCVDCVTRYWYQYEYLGTGTVGMERFDSVCGVLVERNTLRCRPYLRGRSWSIVDSRE